MKKSLFCIIALLTSTCSFAQKNNLEKWVKINVDSLYNIGVDTVIYYHYYCGECMVLKPINTTDSTAKSHQCEIDNSWVQIINVIIYQQNGAFFALSFNCSYPPIKSPLKTCSSIPYFISIIPDLDRRDKVQKAMFKKHKFNPPIVVDGGYEEASIYLRKKTQSIDLQEDQKTDTAWRSFFWIDKEAHLLKFIASDIQSLIK